MPKSRNSFEDNRLSLRERYGTACTSAAIAAALAPVIWLYAGATTDPVPPSTRKTCAEDISEDDQSKLAVMEFIGTIELDRACEAVDNED